MTNGEKFKEVFKFGLKIDGHGNFITKDMITCRGLSCDECSLFHHACSNRGLKKWLETEYGEEVDLKGCKEEKSGDSKDELESPDYKKGYEDGKNAVFSELSNIFKRK